MPAYLISAQCGDECLPNERIEQSDFADARRAAVRYAGDLLHADDDCFRRSEEWTVTVADETGLVLFTITLLWTGSPALGSGPVREQDRFR